MALTGKTKESLRRLRKYIHEHYDGLEKSGEAVRDIERITAELIRLKQLCYMAADEIDSHWEAHCGEDGSGPVNLLRRLKGDIGGERY